MNKECRWRTRCYCLDIDTLPASIHLADMPPGRARLMRSLQRREDRLRCAAAWLLLRRFLGGAAARIRRGLYGKPFLPGGPYFSLSHSGSRAVLALAPLPVGVDVEREDAALYSPGLDALALHPEERPFFGLNRRKNFFDIWTLKESYLKMRGMGLHESPAAFALDWTGTHPKIREKPDVHFNLFHDLPGYSLALCQYGGLPPERPIIVTYSQIISGKAHA